MKFTIKKGHLLDALERMKEVSTRGVKQDFDTANTVFIVSSEKKVEFFATNGYMQARFEVTKETDSIYSCELPGKISVDVSVVSGIVSVIGGKSVDIALSVFVENDVLYIQDTSSKTKKKVKIQTLNKDFTFNVSKPKSGTSFTLSCSDFLEGISVVGKYAAKFAYKIIYQMACLHIVKSKTKSEIRFVCGNGSRFAIYCKDVSLPNIKDDEDHKYIIPIDQAAIISSILDGAENVDFVYKNEQCCYIRPHNGMELLLEGIPNEKYVSYEQLAFKSDEAKAILDIKHDDFIEAMAVVKSVRDKDAESGEQKKKFQSCRFTCKDNVLEFNVDENKYQCEYSCEVNFYPVKDIQKYSSLYSAEFLGDVAFSSDQSYVRFYCIDEAKVIIARPVELDDKSKDEFGCPAVKENLDKSKLLFFFTAATEVSA